MTDEIEPRVYAYLGQAPAVRWDQDSKALDDVLIEMWLCGDCGAVVGDTDVHNAWHRNA